MQTVRQFFFIVQILQRNGTHTDDPVHRRSYFVAHAGKKFTLGPACRLDFLQIALNDSGLHPCAADQQNRNNQNQQNERHNGHKQDRIGINHFRKGEPAHADRNHVSIQYCGLFFAGQIINSLICPGKYYNYQRITASALSYITIRLKLKIMASITYISRYAILYIIHILRI